MNINEYLNKWIKRQISKGLKQTTINIYEGYLKNYINKGIGHIELYKLTFYDIQNFYNNVIYDGNIGAKTLKNIHSVIHRALKDAVKAGLIPINQSDYVELPKPKVKEVEVLTEKEISKLREVIKSERLGISIEIALGSGLRLGEIMALRWENIDFNKRQIKVEYSLNRVPVKENYTKRTRLVFSSPKTANSIRRVPLSHRLTIKLLEFKKYQEARYYGMNIEKDPVLSNKYMKPIDPRTIQEFFKKMQIKAGIRHYKFHALRHTFATRAIRTGISDKVISEILGHSDVATTLNIYTHISDDMTRNLIDRMEE